MFLNLTKLTNTSEGLFFEPIVLNIHEICSIEPINSTNTFGIDKSVCRIETRDSKIHMVFGSIHEITQKIKGTKVLLKG